MKKALKVVGVIILLALVLLHQASRQGFFIRSGEHAQYPLTEEAFRVLEPTEDGRYMAILDELPEAVTDSEPLEEVDDVATTDFLPEDAIGETSNVVDVDRGLRTATRLEITGESNILEFIPGADIWHIPGVIVYYSDRFFRKH